MDRMNTHSTNNNGLLSRSESRSAATTSSPSQFDLQWGSRKGLRCMKVHGKDHSTSNDSTGSRTVRRATARIDRRAVRSDTDNNAGKDPITNRSGGGHLNLRQRPASPSRRILRNSEVSIAMKGHSNGVRDLSPSINTNTNNNNNNNNHNNSNNKNNNFNNHHNNGNHHHAAAGGGSPDTAAAAVWPQFAIALTNKEKEEDFLAIKGSKLPQRPKKRAKFIQRTLNLVSPGAWLCDLTLERYEVREKKVSKKRPRGIKAMGNMESDSE